MTGYSVFPSVIAQSIERKSARWDEIVKHLSTPKEYPSKANCPLIKLATFGDKPTDSGCLRSDDNMLEVFGIEGDYDDEVVTVEEAAAALRGAGVKAFLYTSAGHEVMAPPKYNGGPRWRVLAPLSRPCSPQERAGVVALLNGVLGGILAGESFTQSQSFYFGKVRGVKYEAIAIDGPFCIDELDFVVTPIFHTPSGGAPQRKKTKAEHLDDAALRDPVFLLLDERGMVEKHMGDGKYSILCPFEEEHSDYGQRAEGDGDTAYWIAHTGGHDRGRFHCTHDHCSNRGREEFLAKIGYYEERRRQQLAEFQAIGAGDDFSAEPEIMTTDEMLARMVFLRDGSRVFDVRHPMHTVSFSDFKQTMAASYTEEPTGEFNNAGKPKMRRSQNASTWLSHAKRQTAHSVTFRAGAGIFTEDPEGRQCVNLWNGYRHTLGDPSEAAIFVEHIRWLFGDRADDFLDWLAHIVQKPGELPHTIWLHISPFTGTGRNWISGVLAKVLTGYAALSVDLIGMLESPFNAVISRKVLAVVDEIREGGSGQWRHAENLKQIITAPVRKINAKYGRETLEHNACRWLIFSNHRNAIPLSDEDRRVEVVSCNDQPKSEGYYSLLYQVLDDKGFISGVAAFLAYRDIRHFNPGRHAKLTADKQATIAASRSPILTELIEFSREYPFELVTAARLSAVVGGAVGPEAKAFAHAANEAGWEKLGRKRINSQRPVIYARREVFEKWTKNPPDFSEQLPKEDGGRCAWPQMATDGHSLSIEDISI